VSPRRPTTPGLVARVVDLTAVCLVQILSHLVPQRWCPPAISLRLYRLCSRAGTTTTAADIARHRPACSWTTRTELEYAATGRDGLFDLVLPAGAGPHPVVVWLHGGGWHFGHKGNVLPYAEILASYGYAVAVPNYPLAPGSRYPAAPRAVNAALAHLVSKAVELGIDPTRIVLAGDSAGAQVAAEVATLTTSPFAEQCGTTPALSPDQLRGTVLFCGIYDTDALVDSDRMFQAVLETAMWSLSGDRNWKASDANRLMSIRNHVTETFPATFLAAGNADPLTRRQTPPLALRLRQLGVPLDEYYPGTAEDPINHEFQFLLGTEAAVEALRCTVEFLAKVTAR
jgi:acetyl esterase/lipase